jgi:uncharacterized iron-regulated membrane protein
MIEAIHRWGGGLIGLFLALLGLSGALLIHRDPLVALTLPKEIKADTDTLIKQFASNPDLQARFIFLPSERFGHWRIMGPDNSGAYLDGAGTVLAKWDHGWQRPEWFLFDLHTNLLLGETGSLVTGLFAVGGLLFVGTGLWLWWPLRKTFAWRLWPKRLSRPSIVRHHRDLGVIMAPLLTLSLLTGAAMAIKPIGAILVMPLNSPAELQAALVPPDAAGADPAKPIAWPRILRETRAAYPKAELRIIGLPQTANKPMFMRVRQPGEWTANGRTMLWFHPQTGSLLSHEDGLNLIPGLQAYFSFLPLHTGEAGGTVMRIVMTLSGLALGLLGSFAVWTFWLRSPVKQRRPARSAVAVTQDAP